MGADVEVEVDPITINVAGLDSIDADVDIDLGLDDIKADLRARIEELAPVLFKFLWEEIPLVRVSLPHKYRLGFCLLGKEIWSLEFCGESEVVTEKNPCGKPPAAGA